MASGSVLRICIKWAINSYLYRSKKFPVHLLRSLQYSTTKITKKDEVGPVKYTSHQASKVSIAENLHFVTKDDRPSFQPYVVILSVIIFMVYFCILREENDIDELLKGNPDYKNDQHKLLDLQVKLNFCEKHLLPIGNLKEQIEELQKRIEKDKIAK